MLCALTRAVSPAISRCELTHLDRAPVDHARAVIQHSAYEQALATLNIQEVMWESGYNDDKSFRNVFKKYAGISPAEYRSKYNREMALI